jgi:hypothetical protein
MNPENAPTRIATISMTVMRCMQRPVVTMPLG